MMSRTIFAPAVALMGRLRLSAKMLLVGSIVTMVVVFLVGVLAVERVAALQVLAHERVGLRFVTANMKLVGALQQHRGLSTAMLSGDASLRQKVADKGAEVEQRLADILALAREARRRVAGPDRPGGPGGALERDRDGLEGRSPKDNLALHTGLIEDLLDTMRRAADRSGLSLDSYADTFMMQELL